MKVDILAIGVHPDDVELSCSGTLLKHIEMGKKVGLLDLTRGELGSRGTADIRDQEAANSAAKMGALFRKNARMKDGYFQYSPENINKVIQVIRFCKPEIVLANAISDRHPDHGRAAKLVSDACFYSGLVKIETRDESGNIQEKWRPKALYHYIQDRYNEPDFVVDITPYIPKKLELIQTFSSQFFVPGNDKGKQDKEPTTPISTAAFYEYIQSKDKLFGRSINAEFAEGYVAGRIPGVNSLFDLI